jgi:hypothetical protein
MFLVFLVLESKMDATDTIANAAADANASRITTGTPTRRF